MALREGCGIPGSDGLKSSRAQSPANLGRRPPHFLDVLAEPPPALAILDEPLEVRTTFGAAPVVAAAHHHCHAGPFLPRGARPILLQVGAVVDVEIEVAARTKGARRGSCYAHQIRLAQHVIHGVVLAGDQVDRLRQPEGGHVALPDDHGRSRATGFGAGDAAHDGRKVDGINFDSPASELERGPAGAAGKLAGRADAWKQRPKNRPAGAAVGGTMGREEPVVVLGELRVRSLGHGVRRYSMRGNGMVSRTCSSPQIQATTRSMPMPKPECGTLP